METKVYQLTLNEDEAKALCLAWGVVCSILLRDKQTFKLSTSEFLAHAEKTKKLQDEGGPEAGVESLSEKLGQFAGEVVN